MTDRIEAVAEALRRRYRADEPFTPAALAPIAVAALDAYDEGHRPEASDISAASWANLLRILDAREVRRREIIASEIDHARDERDAALSANDAGRYEDGFVDGLDHAARIARGQS